MKIMQSGQAEQAAQKEQIVKGRCRVWNDRFLYPDSKMIVSISPSIYKYVASDGTMWKNAERIATSKQALAYIWKSKRQQ